MTISVVIPVYNDANILVDCLKSLEGQSRKADQIIVVDNNSTDGLQSVIQQYNVILVPENHQGIAAASKTGMDAASSDIIARCDADSRLPAHWLATIERAFNDESIAAVTGMGKFYDIGAFMSWFAMGWYMYAYFILVGSAIARWPLFGSNYAIRKSVWNTISNKVHAERNDIHDDIDVTMHLSNEQKVRFLRNIEVGISGRALKKAQLRTRYRRGLNSLIIHWPEQAPVKCWRQKFKQ